MTPTDQGYQRIFSFFTLSSDTTDVNARGARALPVWLWAPGSAPNCSQALQPWVTADQLGHMCVKLRKILTRGNIVPSEKNRENKTTFTSISTTVLFRDISLQIFSCTFSKAVTVAYIQLCFLFLQQLLLLYQGSPVLCSLSQPSPCPGESDLFRPLCVTILWIKLLWNFTNRPKHQAPLIDLSPSKAGWL